MIPLTFSLINQEIVAAASSYNETVVDAGLAMKGWMFRRWSRAVLRR